MTTVLKASDWPNSQLGSVTMCSKLVRRLRAQQHRSIVVRRGGNIGGSFNDSG